MSLSSLASLSNIAGFVKGVLSLDIFSILGKKPGFVADFDGEYYRAAGSPTTFSGAITHAATSNATMTDSDGYIKWRPHNLLTNSGDITGWSGYGAGGAIAASATAAPDSGVGDVFRVTGSAINEGAGKTVTIPVAGSYIGKVYARSRTGATQTVGIAWAGTSSSDPVVLPADGSWTWITGTASLGAGSRALNVLSEAAAAIDIDICAAHAIYAGLGGTVNNPDRSDTYVATSGSAVYLPRRGHYIYDGVSAWVNEGVLHESEARTNLLTYSEDLSDASWVARCFAKVGTAAGPLGTTAYEFLENSSSSNPAIYYNSNATDGTPRTFGVWLKASAPVTMALSTQGATKSTDISVTTEWAFYWVSDSFNSGTGPHIGGFNTLSVGSGITLWVAMPQQEAGSTPSSYIPTSGATATRAAETLTIPSANLPWPSPEVIGSNVYAGANAVGDDTNATTGFTAASGTLLSSQSGETNGSSYAFEAETNTTPTANGGIYIDISSLGLTSGTPYQISVDYRHVGTGGRWAIQMASATNTADGPVIDSAVETADTTWTTGTCEFVEGDSTAVYLRFREVNGSNDGGLYIDNLTIKEINPLSVSLQMDGRVTYADEDSSLALTFASWLAGANDYIQLVFDTTSTNNRFWTRQSQSGVGVDSVFGSNTFAPDILVPFDIASRHGSTFINGAVDGVALTANTTPTALPDLSSTDLRLGYDYMGTIKTFRVWNVDLTDAGIEEAST